MKENCCGLVSISFRDRSPEEIASAVRRAGLDAVEWGGDVHVPHGDTATAEKVRAISDGLALPEYGSYYRIGQSEAALFDAALASADCAILSYWTGRTLRRPNGHWNTLHTVAVQRSFAGVEICNWANDWPAPHSARSIEDFLRREGGEPVCLFALKAVDKRGGKEY